MRGWSRVLLNVECIGAVANVAQSENNGRIRPVIIRGRVPEDRRTRVTVDR